MEPPAREDRTSIGDPRIDHVSKWTGAAHDALSDLKRMTQTATGTKSHGKPGQEGGRFEDYY